MAKGNDELDERELRAAHSILSVIDTGNWTIDPKDVKGAPPGTHDFNLLDGDRSIVAVEVSTLSDAVTTGNYAAWYNKLTSNGLLAVDSISCGWLLMVDSCGSAREVSKKLQAWLLDLESRGERDIRTVAWQAHVFSPPEHRPAGYETWKSMAGAGIVHATVINSLLPGQCHISISGGGFSYDPADRGAVPSFVSDQLASEHRSDVDKLDRVSADRRVLFLWLDPDSHWDIVRSLDHGLPDVDFTNTGSLDEVWIGRHFKDGSVTAYRWQRVGGWSERNVAAAVFIGVNT